jgi:hypothetical protein
MELYTAEVRLLDKQSNRCLQLLAINPLCRTLVLHYRGARRSKADVHASVTYIESGQLSRPYN